MARDSSSKLGCFINILIFAYVVYVAFQVVPVLYDNTELKGQMDNIARRSVVYENNTAMMQEILKKADDLEIPLTKRDVTIRKSGKSVTIKAKYQKEFNLLFTTKKWDFDIEVSAPVFKF